MSNMFRRIAALMTVLVLICTAVSVAGAENYGYKPKRSNPIHLKVHENSKCGLAKGGKLQLTMTKADGTALEAVDFDSSKTSVATVSSDGVVKAKRVGKTRITMTAATGEHYTLTVTVVDPLAPEKIDFTKTVYTTYVGMETDLTTLLQAKPYTEALNLKKLTWGSSNVRVVTVNAKGIMVAQSTGKATVTVKAPNGKTATIAVVVERNILDNIQPAPLMTDIEYGEAIYLKSVEIIHPGVVTCQYWLLFKHYPSVRSTYFSWVEDQISVISKKATIDIVSGNALNIKCRTNGQTIKLFKVTYKGDAVKNTNVKLARYKDKITWDSNFWLNWKY